MITLPISTVHYLSVLISTVIAVVNFILFADEIAFSEILPML